MKKKAVPILILPDITPIPPSLGQWMKKRAVLILPDITPIPPSPGQWLKKRAVPILILPDITPIPTIPRSMDEEKSSAHSHSPRHNTYTHHP